jgi:uncharacterized membrane protein
MSKPVGIVLIVIGIAMLAYSSFTYTKRETVVDAGPLHISADRQKTVSWPPVLGGVVLIAGAVIVFTAKKKG